MTDREFWLTVRRALAMVAHAVYKRWGSEALCIVLGIDAEKRNPAG